MSGPGRPSAHLFDLTRLVSRVGRGVWTGIDRVEAAYLAHLREDPRPLYGLVGLSGGFVLLDRTGVDALAARLTGAAPWGTADLRARLHLKASAAKQAARADLRRLARDRSGTPGLTRMLERHLPKATVWLNTGHSNLQDAVFDAVHALSGRAVVLVHDTIPLDWPRFQRPGTVESFAARMRVVSTKADLVICNSEATHRDVARHFSGFGRVPDLVVAPLGVTPPRPDRQALPGGVDLARPRFVTLGTIEPRKNHALLLDVWENFASTLPETDIPALHVIGARGWANETVFDRLDRSPLIGRHLFEHGALADGPAAALVDGARGVLMPSLAEGFGLPPAEALALGTPVIATDLPVYREILGNNPVYLNGTDMYSWANQILAFSRGQARTHTAARGEATALPTWQDHFNLVFRVI
ncbi:MAG TPA: glycosyltransferase family 1 protein [Rhodobacteraceae bacterium]|nr:glycosyltransferase family 1 protein [Paracoccaceae bacterium]